MNLTTMTLTWVLAALAAVMIISLSVRHHLKRRRCAKIRAAAEQAIEALKSRVARAVLMRDLKVCAMVPELVANIHRTADRAELELPDRIRKVLADLHRRALELTLGPKTIPTRTPWVGDLPALPMAPLHETVLPVSLGTEPVTVDDGPDIRVEVETAADEQTRLEIENMIDSALQETPDDGAPAMLAAPPTEAHSSEIVVFSTSMLDDAPPAPGQSELEPEHGPMTLEGWSRLQEAALAAPLGQNDGATSPPPAPDPDRLRQDP